MKRTVKGNRGPIPYTLIQSVRKTILIKVLPDNTVRVYAPKAVRLRDIDAFVLQKHDWIEDTLRANREADEARANILLQDGGTLMVEGRAVTLCLRQERCLPQLTHDTLFVGIGCTAATPQEIRSAVKQALVQLAHTRLHECLAVYAPRVGVTYGRVTIREQRTRWGSCSAKGNLNFNWKLILAPKEALTYVVIHELCHRLEFNHSPRFWRLVEAQMEDYKVWVKWLKEHGKELNI